MKIGEIEKEHYPDVSWNVLVIPYAEEDSRIGRRTVHSSDNPYAWEKNVISTKIDFSKPIVLCLGGTGIDDDQSANGVAKQVQRLLGFGKDDERLKCVQLLSVVYPKDLTRLSSEREKFKQGKPRERLDYIEGIYNTVFRPIIFPQSSLFENSEDVKEKFRNLTIFSHCHGTFVACELIDYLRKDLQNIAKQENFSNAFAKDIIKEITNIMLSPREGIQRTYDSLNIGFSFASDNLPGGVDEKLKQGTDLDVSDFSRKLGKGKIKGSDTFYYKLGGLNNFWDTDTFGADIEFIEDRYSDLGFEGLPSLIYENLYARETPHFHLFENYCSMRAICEDERAGRIQKNEKGVNFTKIIAKALQNAVSLSFEGKKRNLENIISNDTKFSLYKDSNNIITSEDVPFVGSLKTFAENYNKIRKSNTSTVSPLPQPPSTGTVVQKTIMDEKTR